MNFISIAKSAKEAALQAADLTCKTKDAALLRIAESLEEHKNEIFEANQKRPARC